MCLVYNRTGIVLVHRYYVTCLNLLFSNSRVQIYIWKERLLDMRTDVRTVPPAKDVEHVGDVPVRRRWVQPARRPVSMIWSIQIPPAMRSRTIARRHVATVETGRRKKSVLVGPLHEADVFVSASDNNVKSLVEHNWMSSIEACKREWTYL